MSRDQQGLIGSQAFSTESAEEPYRDALREAEIGLERVRALGGWRRDSDGEESIYGKGLKAATLYQEIEKVRYAELNLSFLHQT